MRKLRYFFSMIAMVYAAVAWSAVNSTFTANTIEGVSLTYKITSEGTYNFVQVGTGVDYWATWGSYPDVVTGTTVTIPETVTCIPKLQEHQYYCAPIRCQHFGQIRFPRLCGSGKHAPGQHSDNHCR